MNVADSMLEELVNIRTSKSVCNRGYSKPVELMQLVEALVRARVVESSVCTRRSLNLRSKQNGVYVQPWFLPYASSWSSSRNHEAKLK